MINTLITDLFANMETLKFLPFVTSVRVEFWKFISDYKLDCQKLDESPFEILGHYNIPKTVRSICTLDLVATKCDLLEKKSKNGSLNVFIKGYFKIFNKRQAFEEFNKIDFLKNQTKVINEMISNRTIFTENSTALSAFHVFAFCDLKKHLHEYWSCYPAFINPKWKIKSTNRSDLKLYNRIMTKLFLTDIDHERSCFFIYKIDSSEVKELTYLKSFDFSDSKKCSNIILGLIDPSPTSDPGWPIRNLLYSVWTLGMNHCKILTLKGKENTLIYELEAETINVCEDSSEFKMVGWEKNNGQYTSRKVDLSAFLDSKRIAASSVNLNLKLMKWRQLPELDLLKIENQKVLLCGAGTLGCNVARYLMAWGVRDISFIDNGQISLSNPVRQSLYNFSDSITSQNKKAIIAAEALKRIFPETKSNGYDITIPAIGHPFVDIQDAHDEFLKFESLIKEHDCIFLLTDNRESRWLPTVIGSAYKKLVITVAIGLDSFSIIRHGVRSEDEETTSRLGCYFCNDIISPSNSTRNRTLDQMCTVTRPGVAPIASGYAVELLISFLERHKDLVDEKPTSSVLGDVPHCIRGYLSDFSIQKLSGIAHERCPACSDKITSEYLDKGWSFIQKAIIQHGYLHSMSGLANLELEAEKLSQEIDFDISDDSTGL